MRTGELMAISASWRAGLPVSEIAEAHGINEWTLWTFIRRHRDLFPNRRHHAEWWRERLAEFEGVPSSKAAAKIGCSYETVHNWRRRLLDGTR